ncbi:MAG: PqqD family peptide modification chaperone [Alphaproteobacteria bacterium]|nr:PqqD family peptide modification chaperone [Alphaproteobacteria bacterium]
MDPDSRPRAREYHLIESNRGNIAVSIDGLSDTIELNQSALDILRLCNGKNVVSDIAKQLAENYGIQVGSISRDVDHCVEILAAIGAIDPFDVVCVVSDRFEFICLLLPKNASSTLREELRRDIYESREHRYTTISPEIRNRYYTFAALREPISRLLSAYQEVSYRFELTSMGQSGRDFFTMKDTPARFKRFLSELGSACWDIHLLPQARLLSGVRVDQFFHVERIQDGMSNVFERLNMGKCPTLPVSRSRGARAEDLGYRRYMIKPDDLDQSSLSFIERVYEADIRLLRELEYSHGIR